MYVSTKEQFEGRSLLIKMLRSRDNVPDDA